MWMTVTNERKYCIPLLKLKKAPSPAPAPTPALAVVQVSTVGREPYSLNCHSFDMPSAITIQGHAGAKC